MLCKLRCCLIRLGPCWRCSPCAGEPPRQETAERLRCLLAPSLRHRAGKETNNCLLSPPGTPAQRHKHVTSSRSRGGCKNSFSLGRQGWRPDSGTAREPLTSPLRSAEGTGCGTRCRPCLSVLVSEFKVYQTREAGVLHGGLCSQSQKDVGRRRRTICMKTSFSTGPK